MHRSFAITCRLILFVLAAALLGGCASTGRLSATMPVTSKLANYKTAMVCVSCQSPDSSKEVAQLESMTVAKLREKGTFEKVLADSSSSGVPADLRINAKMVDVKKVGGAQRVLLGALAGQATVVVDTELTDSKTGKRVGSFQAEGKSSGGTVFAGTTEQAIERAAEQIATFVQNNR